MIQCENRKKAYFSLHEGKTICFPANRFGRKSNTVHKVKLHKVKLPLVSVSSDRCEQRIQDFEQK